MPTNLRQITSLRFVAAMWVVAFHFWPSLSPSVPALVGRGYLCVDFFFVLSGFILSHVYLEKLRAGSLPLPRLPLGASGPHLPTSPASA